MNKKIFLIALCVTFLFGLAQACKKRQQETGAHLEQTKAAQNKKELYRCSMHPAVTSDKPGICPICHMNLEKVEDEAATDTGHTPSTGTAHEGHTQNNGTPMTPVEGRASFVLSQDRQQLIGVTKERVEIQDMGKEVRASGRVAFDPDLFTTIEEYRQALLSASQMSDPLLKNQANQLVTSSKTKLRLLGLSEAQIHTLSSSKVSSMSLLLPKGSVWIYAEVFEYEIAGLKSGLTVEVEAPSIPGKSFAGKVSSISPVVNSPTRTVRVQALVPDPTGQLRPDTFVNVKIKLPMGHKLAVPESAVLFSNEQKYVFVVNDKGRFEPRMIQTGYKARDFYEVTSGLSEGEVVVTSANFLIDSESRLKGVLEGPIHGGHERK
jgi:membrane fusion protein, copper/silver efflux system